MSVAAGLGRHAPCNSHRPLVAGSVHRRVSARRHHRPEPPLPQRSPQEPPTPYLVLASLPISPPGEFGLFEQYPHDLFDDKDPRIWARALYRARGGVRLSDVDIAKRPCLRCSRKRSRDLRGGSSPGRSSAPLSCFRPAGVERPRPKLPLSSTTPCRTRVPAFARATKCGRRPAHRLGAPERRAAAQSLHAVERRAIVLGGARELAARSARAIETIL